MAKDTDLNIVIKAQNEAEKTFKKVNKNMDGLQGKIKSLNGTFKKMAIAGGAAFGALAFGASKAINEAAKAEGSYNKFNTVFGEHKDDMMEYVNNIRKEMPTATHEIVRMAADLQDLLVPLGLARDKATDLSKGFLDVANKIAAFNDVDPTEVLEAVKSGLAGSTEPLRRFGVNALETSLEARALQMGLLEAGQGFKDLDPEVKNQIRAQALLAQVIDNSSDAINGFEANNDSFIRRQQELNATTKEITATLGEAFLPIVDSILKKVLPVVGNIANWAKENKQLTIMIIGVVAGLTGLVAILGTLGLLLPGIITSFTFLGTTFAFLAGPIGIIIALLGVIIATGWNLYNQWDTITWGFNEWIKAIKKLFTDLKVFFENILKSIQNEFSTVWGAITGIVEKAAKKIDAFIRPVLEKIDNLLGKLASIGSSIGGGITTAKERVKGFLGFEKGGIVPGKKGEPVPAIVHGGEKIIPAGKSAGGVNITITGNTFMSDQETAEKIGDMILEGLKLRERFIA